MTMGTGIFLVVVGAILRFAVSLAVPGVSLPLIGDILIGAGIIVFIIGLVLMFRRRSTVTTDRTLVDPASGAQVREQRSTDTTPPTV